MNGKGSWRLKQLLPKLCISLQRIFLPNTFLSYLYDLSSQSVLLQTASSIRESLAWQGLANITKIFTWIFIWFGKRICFGCGLLSSCNLCKFCMETRLKKALRYVRAANFLLSQKDSLFVPEIAAIIQLQDKKYHQHDMTNPNKGPWFMRQNWRLHLSLESKGRATSRFCL